jgi:hypothetical protein
MQSRIHRPISPSLSNARRSSARPCDPTDSFSAFLSLVREYRIPCYRSQTPLCLRRTGLSASKNFRYFAMYMFFREGREQSIMIFSVLRNMHVLRRIILSSNTHQSNFHVMNMEHNERTVTQSQYFKRLPYQL